MNAIQIIGILLLIAAVLVFQFVEGSTGLMVGIVLGLAGAAMAGVFGRNKK